MPIPTTCPECFAEFPVPEKYAGRRIKCKSCGATVRVPEPTDGSPDDELDVVDDDASGVALPPWAVRKTSPVRASSAPARPPARKGAGGNRTVAYWLLGIGGGAVALGLLCCGGAYFAVNRAANDVEVADYPDLPDFGDPTSPFPVGRIAVPDFPDLGTGTAVGEKGVTSHEVDCSQVASNRGAPGMRMRMRVLLPAGDVRPKSRACVLVAPAGSTLLEGMPLGDGEYLDETLPYAEAGFVVVHYSIDGSEDDGPADENVLKGPYLRFRASCAGVVNTRNAYEFAARKIAAVDPAKVYAVGHSSAATLSLLALEHEPRLAGAVAYAPEVDVAKSLEHLSESPLLAGLIAAPRATEFSVQSSPKTHVASIHGSVFLFHADGDENTSYAATKEFYERLKAGGKDVTFVSADPPADTEPEPAGPAPETPAEDSIEADETAEDEDLDEGVDLHYDPMIEDGIPKAIEWLRRKTGAA